MKFTKFATSIAVVAALLGQTGAINVKESHRVNGKSDNKQTNNQFEGENVEILSQSDTHIEIGMKQQQTTKAEAEQRSEAQINLKSAASLAPDVYGPNGENYGNNNPMYDYSRIKIDIRNQGTGDKCRTGNWIKTHWTGSLMKDGRVFTDTLQESNQGHPGEAKIFTLGAHHVIKCLDIALTQLSAGAKAHIECPSFYAYGGALTQSFLKGGLPLPLHADVEYELEVIDCNLTPQDAPEKKPEPKVGIQPHRQMSLHIAKDLGGQDLVLCCQDDDYLKSPQFAHWPGIQCYLEEYIKGDQNQLWVWDDFTFFLKNVATGMYLANNNRQLIMAEYDHINWNLADPHFPRYAQWFEFCPWEHVLETEVDGYAAYASVQPTIKLRNDIHILGFTEKDTQEVLDRGIFRPQYEFKNW